MPLSVGQKPFRVLFAGLALLAACAGPAFSEDSQARTRLNLTGEEQAWLEAHPVITLAVDDNYPPKNFRNADGELAGISIDYLRLLEERLGIEIRLEGSPWQEALEKAMAHQVDGIINADLLEERKPYLNFTDVYVVYPQALLARAEESMVASLDDFGGRTLALKRDTSQLAIVRRQHPSIAIREVDDVGEAIDLLVEGEVDGVFDDLAVLYHNVSERFLTNLKFAMVYSEPPVGYSRIAVRNDEPLLLSVLNRAIDSISDSDRREIEMRWLGIELPRFTPAEPGVAPSFSDQELAWLRAHPVLRVASDPNWAPIEFREPSGEFRGIAIDYLREAVSILGVEAEFVEDKNWAELLELGAAGQVDVFSAMAYTEERAKRYTFTESFLTVPIMVFARDEVAYVGDLSELYGKRVSVVRSYTVEGWLERDHPDIRLVRVETVYDALDAVTSGDADAYVGNIVTASYYLNRRGYANIKVVGETPYSYDQRIAVRADAPLLASAMQKAFASIPQSRRNAIYQKWVASPYSPGFPYSLLWKVGLAVLAVILLILFWNYRLTRAVAQRTAALSSANEALRQSEERAKGIVSSIADPMLMLDRNRTITWANERAQALFGALVGKPCEEALRCEETPCENCAAFRALSTNSVHDSETTMMDTEGNARHFWCTAGIAAYDEEGRPAAVVEILRDITERKQHENARRLLEEQLRQAQKMEAVGQLAGGIAHDFNNLLQVIRGNVELVTDELPPGSMERAGLDEIDRAAERATTLVRQLLAFGRRERLELQTLDMNEVVSGLIKMIRRLIGEHIEMTFEPGAGEVTVYADRGQMEQIVVNLCVNARDAMQQGGTLRLEVENREIDDAFTSRFMEADPGHYVVLSVIDSGTGIHPDIQERIFEPFFTTKGVGEGTGLGLATVYAIVKRHLGFVDLESHLGRGSTFRVYLPLHVPGMEEAEDEEEAPTPSLNGNNETILIAEDDEQVRLLAQRVLKRAGYRVLLARDGEEAMAAVIENLEDIDLVLLDVVMPKKSGGDVYAEITARFPRLQVLLMSGYSFDVLNKGHLPGSQMEILRKPFRSDTLLQCVRDALAR